MEDLPVFRHKRSGRPKLKDDDVKVCRQLVGLVTITQLAIRYRVSYPTMWNAVKGVTYRHLNAIAPPQW